MINQTLYLFKSPVKTTRNVELQWPQVTLFLPQFTLITHLQHPDSCPKITEYSFHVMDPFQRNDNV